MRVGIDPSDWDTPEERAVVDRVRAELGVETPAVTVAPPPAAKRARKVRTSTAAAKRPPVKKARAARRLPPATDAAA